MSLCSDVTECSSEVACWKDREISKSDYRSLLQSRFVEVILVNRNDLVEIRDSMTELRADSADKKVIKWRHHA